MGHIFIGVVVAVAVIVIAPLVRRLWIGNRMVTGLLTGKFGQTPLEHELAAWFRERPARAEQRNLFVGVQLGLGGLKGIVADRLMACIAEVWRTEGAQFGDLLAQEMDRLIVCDPQTTEETRMQPVALEKFNELKARLRSLDDAGTECARTTAG